MIVSGNTSRLVGWQASGSWLLGSNSRNCKSYHICSVLNELKFIFSVKGHSSTTDFLTLPLRGVGLSFQVWCRVFPRLPSRPPCNQKTKRQPVSQSLCPDKPLVPCTPQSPELGRHGALLPLSSVERFRSRRFSLAESMSEPKYCRV